MHIFKSNPRCIARIFYSMSRYQDNYNNLRRISESPKTLGPYWIGWIIFFGKILMYSFFKVTPKNWFVGVFREFQNFFENKFLIISTITCQISIFRAFSVKYFNKILVYFSILYLESPEIPQIKENWIFKLFHNFKKIHSYQI